MHVIFLTSEYPHRPCGGIGTSIRNLARALVAGGHRATVLGCGARAEFDDRGVHVRFLERAKLPKMGWLLNRRALQREIVRLVRYEGADLVEAHDWCGPSAGLRLPCPVMIRCNGSATYFSGLLGERVRPSVRLAEWLALNQAQDIVAVSRFAAEQTRRAFGIRREIGIIPNSIDPGQFPVADPDEVDPNTILYFGTLVRKKGVLDLGRIFLGVLERTSRARLVLVGRDSADRQTGAPSTWALLEQTLPARVRGRVEYLGPRPHDEVQRHVRRAGICLFPSYAEALPLSWMEAMACGKAVVAYDVGWAPEMIESGVCGTLVKAGDIDAAAAAIAALLGDPERSRSFGMAARRVVEGRYASHVVAQQTLNRYRNVLGEAA